METAELATVGITAHPDVHRAKMIF
jgi:hypothetical protein